MANINITLSVLDDLQRDFPLVVRQAEFANVARPTLDQCDPMDISGATFSAAVAVDGTRIFVPITVTVVDPVNSKIRLSLDRSKHKAFVDKPSSYYVLMVQNGKYSRLWRGSYTVTSETEQ
jgi:hypothetical protein